MEITGADLASLSGVTPQAVSQANLERTERGLYDTDNPQIASYIRRGAGRTGYQRKNREPELSEGDFDELSKEKLQWDIEYGKAKTAEKELKNAILKKVLIHQDLVKEAFGTIGGAIRTYLLGTGKRLAPRVFSAIQSGQQVSEIEAMIDTEITDIVKRVLSSTDQAIEKLVEDWDEIDIEDDEAED